MEEKIVTCQICGKEYPMCLTTRATKEITEKFGSVEEAGALIANLQGNIGQALALALWLLGVLLRDGAALRNLLHPEEAPISPPPGELLELLPPGELIGLRDQIFLAMAVGMGREVESEPEKNREAGQTGADSLPG